MAKRKQVPDELRQSRKNGESFKAYKQRLRDGQKTIKTYLKGYYKTRMAPSVRILRRIMKGKRNPNSVRASKRRYIERVLMIPFNDLVHIANGNDNLADKKSVRRVNTLLTVTQK